MFGWSIDTRCAAIANQRRIGRAGEPDCDPIVTGPWWIGPGTKPKNWLPAVASASHRVISDTHHRPVQTAAGLENLAVATYQKALSLPFIGFAPPVVKAFAEKTMGQHSEHATAFNAAVIPLGGQAPDGP